MDDACVHAGAHVESSILGVGAVVEEGVTLERCVLGDGVRVTKEEHLVDVRRAA
jgi:ADP-glucose pyrophosphorylase